MKNLKIISTADARKNFAEVTDEVRTKRVSYSIVRHGKEVARIVPPTETENAQSDDVNMAITQFVEEYDDALTKLAKR